MPQLESTERPSNLRRGPLRRTNMEEEKKKTFTLLKDRDRKSANRSETKRRKDNKTELHKDNKAELHRQMQNIL